MRLYVLCLLYLAPCVWAENKTPFEIRKGLDRDITEILQIDHANGGSLNEKSVRGELHLQDSNFAVALGDHRVLGFMVYGASGKAIELRRLGTAPGQKGVAEALAQSLLTRVATDGPTLVRAELPAQRKDWVEAFTGSQFEIVFERAGRLTLEAAPQSRLVIDPAQLEFQTYYELLGVAEEAQPDEIRRAFERRSAANASDPVVGAQLTAARDVLLSGERRAAYDETHVADLEGVADRVRGNEGGPASRYHRRLYPHSPTLYHRLGVSPNASPELIVSAYQRAVRLLYASFPPGNRRIDRAQKAVDEAFAVLGRPALREAYDKLLTVAGGVDHSAAKQLLRQAPQELPSLQESLGFNTQAASAYDILGVNPKAPPGEIHAKYNELKARYPGLNWKFPQVVNAYRILSNEALRGYYDHHYPGLTLQGRRAMLNEMVLFEETYLDRAAEDRDKGEYAITPPFAFEGDGRREPAADPTEKRTEPLLYRMLGVTRNASPADIHRGYALMKRIAAGNSQQLSEGENAYLVLSNPNYKRQYDRTLSGMDAIDIAKDREAAVTIMALARVNEIVDNPGTRGVDEFVGPTFQNLRHVGDSAGLAKKYLQQLLAAVDRTPGPLRESSFKQAIAATDAVGLHFTGPEWNEIRDLEQQVRGRLVARAISESTDSPTRDRFLAAYLSIRPPDYLSARLRDARDAMAAGSHLPGAPFCDWSRIRHG